MKRSQLSRVLSIFRKSSSAVFAVLAVIWLATGYQVSVAQAQSTDQADQKLSEGQLEQLVAPIALHPDSLLSQILMASTYPLEVVEAARWVQKNPKVTGEALEDAMEQKQWDASVKSLTAFPEVLAMMNDDLSWTQQLGDAFLAQQQDVLDAVQRLRDRAANEGNLESTKEQKVEKQTVTTTSGQKETVYVIERADPKVIYVPSYDPLVIYGAWPYPTYPPYYWYPPRYVPSRAFWFATGVVVGNALWGRCDWGRGSVNINVRTYNSFNRTNISNTNWNHNPRHRRAVPYKGRDVANRYGRGPRDLKAREQFRGRAEAGRRDLQRPGTDKRPGAGLRPGDGKFPSADRRPGKPDRPTADRRPAQRPQKPKKPDRVAARPAPSKPRPTHRARPKQSPAAFRDIGRGKQVRRESNRGRASRSASRSRPARSHRSGGGRRGGGRRR